MSLSKTRRFEIFKRDLFTCQYCGQRPPEVILEVDHIEPRANGGGDEELNLITACADCNRGKSARLLSDVRPRPDADMAYLEVQQEIVEAKRFLAAQAAHAELFPQVAAALKRIMIDSFGWVGAFDDDVWRFYLVNYSAEEVAEALRIMGPKIRGGFISTSMGDVKRYISGVLRNRRSE